MIHSISFTPHPGHRAEFAVISWSPIGGLQTFSKHEGPIRALVLPLKPERPRAVAYIVVPDELHPFHNTQDDPGIVAQIGSFAPLTGACYRACLSGLATGFDLPPNPSLMACEIANPPNLLYNIHGMRGLAANASALYLDTLHKNQSAYARACAPQF